MIPDNAFLRRLPAALDGAQAVHLEALVFSADSIEGSYVAIREIAASLGEQICNAPCRVRTELFTRAWAIVDCLHVVRQILEALGYQTPLAASFREKYEVATKLRNVMDHLNSNAGNVAKAENRPPVFGVVGYIHIPADKVVMGNGPAHFTGGATVMLSAGRFSGGRVMTAVNPADLSVLRSPVCGFRLEAFGQFLELEQAEHDLRMLMIEVNKRLDEDVTERAALLSKERGVSIEKILANDASGLCLYLVFKTGNPATQA